MSNLEPDDVKSVSINFAYWLVDDADWSRIIAADHGLGWSRKPFLNQIVASWCAVPAHQEWFKQAAEMDAIARGYDQHQGDHFTALSQWSDQYPLHPYMPLEDQDTAEVGPPPDWEEGGEMPMASDAIEIPEKLPANKRLVKRIDLSPANMACLHLYSIASENPPIESLALITRWHLKRYWNKSYTRQLQASRQKTLDPEL